MIGFASHRIVTMNESAQSVPKINAIKTYHFTFKKSLTQLLIT